MAHQTTSTAEHLSADITPSPMKRGAVGVRRWRGVLTEVSLQPEPHVCIQTPEEKEHRFRATEELAQNVCELRGKEIEAMCTCGEEHPRVIWLHAADQVPPTLSPQAALEDGLRRWKKTLEILAQSRG